MPILDRCWTPFMVYSWTTVKHGCYYTAMYTGVLHILFLCYAIYVMDGGDSDEFYSPFFELDIYGTEVAGWCTIIFCCIFLVECIMLVFGIKQANRCLFFPWMIAMTLEILLMVAIGLWFIFRYYRNLYTFLATLVLWTFDGLHIYCLLCVVSHYQVLKEIQEPKFVILYP